MKKKAIIVECLSSGVNYISDFREMGIEPLLLERWAPPEIAKAERAEYDEAYTLNGDELPKIIKADRSYEITLEMIRKINPVLIIPGTESGIELAAKLSCDLGLPSNDILIFPKMKDKYYMQATLKKAKLRYIETAIVNDISDAISFFLTHNRKPVVVKVSRCSSSYGVLVCRNTSEIIDAINKNALIVEELNNNSTIIIQEYIDGKEYAIDTVSCHGKHRTVFGLSYHKRIQNGKHPIYDVDEYINTDAEKYRFLSDYIFNVLDAIGIQYGPVHSEIIVDENGPVLIEVNCRPAGTKVKRDYIDKISGCHETLEALYGYLQPEIFELQFKKFGKYGKQIMFGAVKNIIIQSDIYVKKVKCNEAVKHLESHDYCITCGENRLYRQTVDLNTNGGMIFLCHKEKKQLKNDLDYIELLENEYLEKLFDF